MPTDGERHETWRHGHPCLETAEASGCSPPPRFLQTDTARVQRSLEKDPVGSGSHDVRVALEHTDLLGGSSAFEDPDSAEKKRRSLEKGDTSGQIEEDGRCTLENGAHVVGGEVVGMLPGPGASLAKKKRGDQERDTEGTCVQPPSQFVCPITMELMLDPVILASGHTYDRQSITEWLKTRKTDPMTGLRLRHDEMVPNHALKSAIVEWSEKVGYGVRMERGASCLPGGGLGGHYGSGGDGQGRREIRGEQHHGTQAHSAEFPSPVALPDAYAMEQAHDEIIWAIKKHGDRLYTASADGTCRVWDVDTKRCIHVFDDHRRPVLCVAIVAGKFVCTGGYDHRINVYAIETYRHVATLEGHRDAVRSLVVVGDKLVSGSYDGTCRCWMLDNIRGAGNHADAAHLVANRASFVCAHVLEGHNGPVRALMAVEGRLYSASYDSNVMCWDVNKGVCLGTLKGHSKPVRALTSISCWCGNQQKQYIVSGSDDMTVRVWDTQNLCCVAVLQGHTDNVRSLASVPGKYVLSGSWDKTIKVWDCARWKEVACLRGHSEAVLALAVSPQAGLVVSGSFDCAIRSWSLQDFHCMHTFDIHADAVRVLDIESLDDEVVCYSGGYDGSVCVLRMSHS